MKLQTVDKTQTT